MVKDLTQKATKVIAKRESALYLSPVSSFLYSITNTRASLIVAFRYIHIVRRCYLKLMSDTGLCPQCNSESVDRVRREGREDWVFDRVYLCGDCGQRSGRAPTGNTTLIARIFIALRLI